MTPARRFLPLLALSAGVIFLHQAGDLMGAVSAMDLGTPVGRVRLASAAVGRMAGLVTADALLLAAALGLGHRRFLRALGLLHVGLGLVLLAAVPFYMADVGGLAATIGPADVTAFRVTVLRVLAGLLVPGLLGMLAGWWLGRIRREVAAAGR